MSTGTLSDPHPIWGCKSEACRVMGVEPEVFVMEIPPEVASTIVLQCAACGAIFTAATMDVVLPTPKGE